MKWNFKSKKQIFKEFMAKRRYSYEIYYEINFKNFFNVINHILSLVFIEFRFM